MHRIGLIKLGTLVGLLPWLHAGLFYISATTSEVFKKEGDFFLMECHFQDVFRNHTLKFVRNDVFIPTPAGGIYFPGDFEISDDLDLHDELDPDTYVVTWNNEEEGTSVNYTLNITKLESGNTGNISCAQLDPEGDIIESDTVRLVVAGPVVELATMIGTKIDEMESWPQTVHHYNKTERSQYVVQILLVFSSVVPQLNVFVAESINSTEKEYLSVKSTPRVSIENSTDDNSPLVRVTQEVSYFYNLDLHFNHNRKKLCVTVHQPTDGKLLLNYFTMNVSYVPVLTGCTPSTISSKIGATVHLTCRLTANPQTDQVKWLYGSLGAEVQMGERHTVTTSVARDEISSSLAIRNLTVDDFQQYYIQGVNSNGISQKANRKENLIKLKEKSGGNRPMSRWAVCLIICLNWWTR